MNKRLKACLKTIERGVKEASPRKKGNLEKAVEYLALKATFNGEIARQVRIADGKSIEDLKDLCGGSHTLIRSYELGLRHPVPKSVVGKRYLSYLASQGYHPIEDIIPV